MLLVKQTLEGIRSSLFERIEAVQADGDLPQPLNLNRGPVRGLIELWAWGLYQLYQFLDFVLKQAFPSTATGLWLDLHCGQVGVSRKKATKARGNIVFYRSGSAGNVPITTGSVIRTPPDGLGNVYRFVTLADVVLQDGEIETLVAVESESYGCAGNVTAGQIREMASVIPGIDGVINQAGWLASEAIDEEDDDSLRLRYQLAWAAINGCTKYAYESWARSVTGVTGVRIMDNHPRGQGTVDVVIRGAAGLPTVELVAAVDAVVNEKKPINDDVIVKGPLAVNVLIIGELELTGGNPADIRLAVENRIRALFSGVVVSGVAPLEIGQDVTRDLLTFLVLGTGSNIKKINWASPVSDIGIPDDGLGVLESLDLTWKWAEA